MLESVTDEIRIAIVKARRCALTGREEHALLCLEKALRDSSLPEVDRAALLLTKAELLYLNGKYTASHEVFVKELDPLSSELPHSVTLVIGLNRCDVAMALFDSDGMSRFYDLLDEQQIARIEHWNDSEILSATRNAAEGRSYESLPTIWRELRRTFRQGRWAAFCQSSRHMAEECIRIGKLPEAAFHAAIARDKDVAKQVGLSLLNLRNADLVSDTIQKLLSTANLQSHFSVACELLQVLSDAVPDLLIDQVIDWVLLRCATVEEPEDHAATEIIAWKTVEALAGRASVNTAEKIVTVALGHRVWKAKAEKPNQIIRVRKEIINAVNENVVSLPVESLDKLADAVIPLATERQNFGDFNNALNLLGHIVRRARHDVKMKIKTALYPSGKAIPPVLMQMAPHFGHEVLNKDDQLEKYASHVANNVKLIVQRVPKDEKPEPVHGAVMTWTSLEEKGQLVVRLISGDTIWAVARNRRQFPTESLYVVIDAVLETISNPDNLLDNRIVLIDCLKEFADCFDNAMARRVFRVLRPIASGKVELSPGIASTTKQSHPLSRTTINSATVEHVVAQALFVLARIEKVHSGIYGARLQAIVEKSLSSDASEVRRCAFAAVREIPAITESTWMPLLLGTRDPDPKAASLAFDAIAVKGNAGLTRAQWRMVAYSLKIAQLSPSIDLRRAAATAVSSLEPQTRQQKLRQELSSIRAVFATDIAHSVRLAATGGLVETA